MTQKSSLNLIEQIFEYLLCTCLVLIAKNTMVNKESVCSSFIEVTSS